MSKFVNAMKQAVNWKEINGCCVNKQSKRINPNELTPWYIYEIIGSIAFTLVLLSMDNEYQDVCMECDNVEKI